MTQPIDRTVVFEPPASRTTRVAALDGLRGLALVGMLAWHAHLDWVRGGFARMTIFFVLSGYLATRSIIRLRAEGCRPTMTFLRGRARRLLPLTLLGVASGVAVTIAVGSVSARQELRGDVLSVLLDVSNWRMIADARPYGAMFESPSAFQHFWSLSAEEQCFWVIPVVLAAVLTLWRHRSWLPVGLTAAVLLALPIALVQSPDAIYYGTPNRAGEFLAGAALALWLDRPQEASRHHVDRRRRAIGAISLVVLVAIMAIVDRETAWLYRGGLALVALPVLGLIAATTTPGGLAVRVLSWTPLVTLGRWALSIYALHWSLYILMGDGRVPLSGSTLALAEIIAAIALGGVVHALVERPLMRSSKVSHPTGRPAAWWRRDRCYLPALGAVALCLVAITLVVPAPPPIYDFEAAQARADHGPARSGASSDAPTGGEDAPTTTGVRVGVFGGSTGVLLGAAAWDWADGQPEVQAVPAWSHYGCGFVTEGMRLGLTPDGSPEENPPDPECGGWESKWNDAARSGGIQVAVVITGVWETTDWILDGTDTPTSIDDPGFDDLVRAKITRSVDDLVADGSRVVLATAPNIGPGTTGHARAARGLPDSHPRRVETYNRLLRDIAAERDDVLAVEYGSWIDSFPPDQSADWLPDGIHPTDDAARQIWLDFLGPSIRDSITTRWANLLPDSLGQPPS